MTCKQWHRLTEIENCFDTLNRMNRNKTKLKTVSEMECKFTHNRWHGMTISFHLYSNLWHFHTFGNKKKNQRKFTIHHSSVNTQKVIILYNIHDSRKYSIFSLFLNDLSLILDKVCSGNYLNSAHFLLDKMIVFFQWRWFFIFFAFINVFSTSSSYTDIL